MSIHYYLNSRKSYSPSREVSVRLVVRRHRHHSLTVTLPIKIQPRYWSAARQRLRRSAPRATEANARLDEIKHFAEGLLLDGVDDDTLRDQLLDRVGRTRESKNTAVPLTLLQLYDQFLEHKSTRSRSSTLRVYRGLKSHLVEFVSEQQLPAAIGAVWLDDLTTFLLAKGLGNATVNKLTTRARGFLDWLHQRGHLDIVPDAPKLPTARNDALYLTRAELARLIELDLSNSSTGFQAARDLFVLASVTGQRFSDVIGMEWDDIRGNQHELTWHLHVKKTSVTLRVPLLGPARRIVERNEAAGESYPVQRLSNQAANRYIKQVGKLAQINESVSEIRLVGGERRKATRSKWECLTMHVSRKTFVTLGLAEAMDADDLLGFTHDDLKTLRLYKGRDDDALRVKMKQAFGGL